ncbi:hypothetical protein [Streptomyces sp. NPDC093598]|uniref:NACHT N-terminal Helical domain 1-containing protein n=1 Tax=Streptomyces sp. NPDC093598 TaxID=3366046 RepID=UPI0038214BD3
MLCPGRGGAAGAEAAALRLGTTVAQTAADIWLGGRRRQQERHLSLPELVRLRVPGLRLQRSAERQFGQITDAVCDTFARADLSDEDVLAADADPAELIRRTPARCPPRWG